MLLSPPARLCVSSVLLLLTLSSSAFPTIASQAASLSALLQQFVPSCAQPCIHSALEEEFTVACTAREDIDCLCSHYSNSGESFGEVAVGCVYASCSSLDCTDSAYGICLGRKAAVMPTKTALTYTVIAGSSSHPTCTASERPTPSGTLIRTTTAHPWSTVSRSAFADTISTLPVATASASPAAAATEAHPKMTPAQIAGLSIAAVAAFITAIGLMGLSVCLRRRREQRISRHGDEKGFRARPRKQFTQLSHYMSLEDQSSTVQLPSVPTPVAHKDKRTVKPANHAAKSITAKSQRPVAGTSDTPSNSVPVGQVGMAISFELDDTSVVSSQSASNPEQSTGGPSRHFSTLTQETVFEEDDVPAQSRSSILPAVPPVPVPLIRNLQSSRYPSTHKVGNSPTGRKSELSLDILARPERPEPRRIIASATTNGSPKAVVPSLRPRFAPAIQTTSSKESVANTASSRNASDDGDIIDHYFSSNQHSTSKASLANFTCLKKSPRTVQIKPKKSLSTTSRRSSHTSSADIRDSLSSQTSFETDPNDVTPEAEDEDSNKRLCSTPAKQPLSPVAESPISKLRYPKVPRSSNQHVARSPRSPVSGKVADNTTPPRIPPRKNSIEPSTLLSKRNDTLPPLLLESPLRPNSPQRDPFVFSPRVPRIHVRSNSAETQIVALPPRRLERQSKVQSGSWGASPITYEERVVRPIGVRGKLDDEMEGRDGEKDGDDHVELKSPVWVPKLTPTRKGEDLWISVGW